MNDQAFSDKLLAWFDREGRKDLPWQRDPAPYRVWVSEIMLQQTQVGTVIPYFERFVRRFPDLRALGEAPLDEVLRHWAGLGYYARARNLHAAAKRILNDLGGRFPAEYERLVELPGVGRSTAGAVLALSLEQRHAILDGNVKRVLARCFAVEGWPGESGVLRRLWAFSERLTPERRVRDYTQAMMDLGATVCTRNRPACDRCPLSGDCRARRLGNPAHYPAPRPRRPLPVRCAQFLLVVNPAREVLLERRPPAGVWGGLWSLPECAGGEDPLQWCRGFFTGEVRRDRAWETRRHTFSHFHLDFTPVEIRVGTTDLRVMERDKWFWYDPVQSPEPALAAPVAQLLRDLSNDLTRRT